MPGQHKRSMFDKAGRDAEIQRRLQAFDDEAEKSEEPEELKTALRRALEEELATAPTLIQSKFGESSDFARLLGGHRIRKVEAAASRKYNYDRTDFPRGAA